MDISRDNRLERRFVVVTILNGFYLGQTADIEFMDLQVRFQSVF